MSMDVTSFFASIASSFKSHYLALAKSVAAPETNYLTVEPEREVQPTSAPAGDTVEISPEAEALAQEAEAGEPAKTETDDTPTAAPNDSDAVVDGDQGEAESNPAIKPDGTYSFQSRTHLEYKMKLQFDLATLTQTISSLAEGDVQTAETLSAGGFGLSADLVISGQRFTKTSVSDDDPTSRSASVARQTVMATGEQMQKFGAQSRDFAVDSFSREAFRIRSAHSVVNNANHTITMNKFSARFQLDSSFSFAMLERFNVQSEQVAETMPESVNTYMTSAGNVAVNGSTEMMASFFDAVDSYLNQAEERLLDNATAFIQAAADELGLSEESVAFLTDQLTSSIESFFNAVDTAVAEVQQIYVPTPIENILPEVGDIGLPEVAYEDPAQLGVDERQALAVG